MSRSGSKGKAKMTSDGENLSLKMEQFDLKVQLVLLSHEKLSQEKRRGLTQFRLDLVGLKLDLSAARDSDSEKLIERGLQTLELKLELFLLQMNMVQPQEQVSNQGSGSKSKSKGEAKKEKALPNPSKKERKLSKQSKFLQENRTLFEGALKEKGLRLAFKPVNRIISAEWKMVHSKDANPELAKSFFPFWDRFEEFCQGQGKVSKDQDTFSEFKDQWFTCLDEFYESEFGVLYRQEKERLEKEGTPFDHKKLFGHVSKLLSEKKKASSSSE